MPDTDVLTGPRVLLRKPELADAESLYAGLASDPEVTRYLSWTPHPDIEETRRVITELFNVGGERTWLIEQLHTGEAVGLCSWRHPQRHSVEFGYCLARQWWRQKIMSEVLPIMVEAVTRDPAVYRVSALCHVDNTASARLLEHCGLAFEGRLVRSAVFPNLSPEPQDTLLYAKAVR